jgi:hypothetical protein
MPDATAPAAQIASSGLCTQVCSRQAQRSGSGWHAGGVSGGAGPPATAGPWVGPSGRQRGGVSGGAGPPATAGPWVGPSGWHAGGSWGVVPPGLTQRSGPWQLPGPACRRLAEAGQPPPGGRNIRQTLHSRSEDDARPRSHPGTCPELAIRMCIPQLSRMCTASRTCVCGRADVHSRPIRAGAGRRSAAGGCCVSSGRGARAARPTRRPGRGR